MTSASPKAADGSLEKDKLPFFNPSFIKSSRPGSNKGAYRMIAVY